MIRTVSVFGFEPIERHHHDRVDRIHAVTKPQAQTIPVEMTAAAAYATAHHVLEGSDHAARNHDLTTFEWYAGHPDANARAHSTATAAGWRVVVSPDVASLPRSPISETPYYVLGPGTVAADTELLALAAAAYASADNHGFGDLLRAHAVVLCLLRTKRLGETLDSWTITRLPGTVFMDHIADPTVLARDLIHEAGHNWLNDALAAVACTLDDIVSFYSPWKQTTRPAFGFIHACWAFPLTMIYSARALNGARSEIADYLTAYLDKQRPLLAATISDHARAMNLITDEGLRRRLVEIHEEALSL